MLYETYPDYITSSGSLFSNYSYPLDELKKRIRSPKELTPLDTSCMPVNALRTLGLSVSGSGYSRRRANSWTAWIDYLRWHDPGLCIREAALVHTDTGIVVSASNTFPVTAQEAKDLAQLVQSGSIPETFQCASKTYCLKTISESTIVGFYGGSYIIISKTDKLLVLAVCTSRVKSLEATEFVEKVAGKLSSAGRHH